MSEVIIGMYYISAPITKINEYCCLLRTVKSVCFKKKQKMKSLDIFDSLTQQVRRVRAFLMGRFYRPKRLFTTLELDVVLVHIIGLMI